MLWDGSATGRELHQTKALFEFSLWKTDPVYLLPQDSMSPLPLWHEIAMLHAEASS